MMAFIGETWWSAQALDRRVRRALSSSQRKSNGGVYPEAQAVWKGRG